MKMKYYVGYCIKSLELFANVEVVNEIEKSMLKTFKTLKIKIIFEKDYTMNELSKKGIELPYYVKEGKNKWVFKIHDRDQLMPELNRLSNNGFKIIEVENNPELRKLIASFI